MAEKDVRGRAGEECAAHYLEAQGWALLDRNWRCAQGELDIVARDGRCIVAVEVKTRRTLTYGHPFEAVTDRKLDRLHRLLRAWLAAHPGAGRGCDLRVDTIAIVGEDPRTGVMEHLRDVAVLR